MGLKFNRDSNKSDKVFTTLSGFMSSLESVEARAAAITPQKRQSAVSSTNVMLSASNEVGGERGLTGTMQQQIVTHKNIDSDQRLHSMRHSIRGLIECPAGLSGIELENYLDENERAWTERLCTSLGITGREYPFYEDRREALSSMMDENPDTYLFVSRAVETGFVNPLLNRFARKRYTDNQKMHVLDENILKVAGVATSVKMQAKIEWLGQVMSMNDNITDLVDNKFASIDNYV